MTTDAMDGKNSNGLTIRLTESAVFLRSHGTGRQPRDDSELRPSMLRGLLTLNLLKPTRISSIELELVATAATSWPEGIGARRIEVTEEHKVFHASTVYFRAGEVQARRNTSIGPEAPHYHDTSWDDQYIPSPLQRNHEETPALGRRLSADNSFFQRNPLSHEEFPITPIPPSSPSVTHPPSPILPSTPASEITPSDFPDYFDADARTRSRSSTGLSLTRPSPSIHSFHPELLLSRRPSVEDVPENEPFLATPTQSPVPSSTSHPPTPPSSIASPDDNRGRRRSRFGLTSVLGDAIQLNSNRTHGSREDERSHLRHGRPTEKEHGAGRMTTSARESKDRSTFRKIGALFKPDDSDNQAGDRWKEFKKGTYTYPISYAIPPNSSPTLLCPYGSVTWCLTAVVHRPGTFTSRFGATREVLVINCPTEDGDESMENIVVERNWDQQLQYFISISGRSFYIGGLIPVMFTFMPLAKVKIHQIHVFIEERVDYYTKMKRITHTDPLKRIELMSLRDTGKIPRPILPLESDNEDVFKNSPLYALVNPEGDPSEVASNYMGPGPWTLTSNLKLPASCRRMHITNKNRKSNIVITHIVKCVIRVERGDDLHVDPQSGKPRLFDIIAQSPVQIFSCRCNPEWTSLPSYLESFHHGFSVTPKCPCTVTHHNESIEVPNTSAEVHTQRMAPEPPHPSLPGVERSAINSTTTLPHDDLLFYRSSQYERLISGQESELGEAPPTYTPMEQ